jgi:hypothetical protein
MAPEGSLPHSQVPATSPFPDKWVPVTMALRVLRLRMEERPPIWTVDANALKKTIADSRQVMVLQLGGWARC